MFDVFDVFDVWRGPLAATASNYKSKLRIQLMITLHLLGVHSYRTNMRAKISFLFCYLSFKNHVIHNKNFFVQHCGGEHKNRCKTKIKKNSAQTIQKEETDFSADNFMIRAVLTLLRLRYINPYTFFFITFCIFFSSSSSFRKHACK